MQQLLVFKTRQLGCTNSFAAWLPCHFSQVGQYHCDSFSLHAAPCRTIEFAAIQLGLFFKHPQQCCSKWLGCYHTGWRNFQHILQKHSAVQQASWVDSTCGRNVLIHSKVFDYFSVVLQHFLHQTWVQGGLCKVSCHPLGHAFLAKAPPLFFCKRSSSCFKRFLLFQEISLVSRDFSFFKRFLSFKCLRTLNSSHTAVHAKF